MPEVGDVKAEGLPGCQDLLPYLSVKSEAGDQNDFHCTDEEPKMQGQEETQRVSSKLVNQTGPRTVLSAS